MNGQDNHFNFSRDPKQNPKRSGNSISDFEEKQRMDQNTSKEKGKSEQKEKTNLNPINSQKMNDNPNNSKLKSMVSMNTPIVGSNNSDVNPISSGMIQAEEQKQRNIITNSSLNKKQPSFSNALTGNMKNPVDAFIDQENGTKEEIKPLDANNMGYNNPDDTKKARKNLKNIIMIIIMIGIVVEILFLVIGTIIRNNKVTTITCTNSNQYDYYKATIKQTRKYSLKKDKIVKLEEQIDYIFYDSAKYLEYKKEHINPPYANIKGRSIMASLNDDNLTYTEKKVYDYNSLLKNNKNTSSDKEHITIETNRKEDTINLVNSNEQGIKTYHSETDTCK